MGHHDISDRALGGATSYHALPAPRCAMLGGDSRDAGALRRFIAELRVAGVRASFQPASECATLRRCDAVFDAPTRHPSLSSLNS